MHSNLIYLIKKLSIDINSISAETGVPATTIFRMKKEGNNPTISTLEPLADFFKVELNDLLYTDLTKGDWQAKIDSRKIPILSLSQIKSWPIKYDNNIQIAIEGNLSPDAFGIVVDSTSMIPIFYENSILIIEPEISEKDNDYVFCKLDDRTIPVIRQIFIDGNKYYFKPVNPHFGELSSSKEYKIIGVIVKSIENYR